jgi:CelD/BcsL family acetyltransferase involved in cellulose biosynthesis
MTGAGEVWPLSCTRTFGKAPADSDQVAAVRARPASRLFASGRSTVPAMINFEAIEDRRTLAACAGRWADVAARGGACAPYLTFEWYRAALESIDSSAEPLLLFVHENGTDVGLIPLVVSLHSIARLPHRRVGFVQNGYTPHQEFIGCSERTDILSRLVSFLKERYGTAFYLDLDELRIEPGGNAAFSAPRQRERMILQWERKVGSRYLPLEADFEHTLSTVDRRTQKEFRRKINRLSKLGEVSLVDVRGKMEIERHIERFFEFRQRTWKGPEHHPEFYRKLCEEFGGRGDCYFSALTLAGKPIAYLISFRGGDTMYGIQTTYDPSFAPYSPGVILFHKFIERINGIPGIRTFDIGRGNEQFKREWTSLVHPHSRLIVFPDTPGWRLYTGTRYKVMPFVRSHRLLNSAYAALRRLAAVRTGPAAGAAAQRTGRGMPLEPCHPQKYLVRSAVQIAPSPDLERREWERQA